MAKTPDEIRMEFIREASVQPLATLVERHRKLLRQNARPEAKVIAAIGEYRFPNQFLIDERESYGAGWG